MLIEKKDTLSIGAKQLTIKQKSMTNNRQTDRQTNRQTHKQAEDGQIENRDNIIQQQTSN